MALYVLARPSSARLRALIALVAGAALAASFAPLSLWPLAVLCPAVLMWLWQDAAPRESAWLGFIFNAGTFAAGTYWLLLSLPLGGAPLWLALLLMLGLTGIMALYHAGLGFACARWLPQSGAVRSLVALPAAWLVVEWWRGWFLSGFSWLSLGYSQTDTWLAGLVPVAGIYGASAALLLSAGALVTLVSGTKRARVSAVAVLLVPWAAGVALRGVSWTQPSGAPVSVAIVQGAVPQDEKWLEANREATLDLYRKLTEQAFGNALIVWPESATADTANDLVSWLTQIYRDAHAHGSALVMGILRAEGGVSDSDTVRYYNSVLALDAKVSWYDKHHLVPFAEYFPVPHFVRSWMRLMSLPYSDFTPGAAYQPPLEAGHLKLGTTVCYEDAYGAAMLEELRRGGADALVNVTNDAWFDHSSARHMHFQVARMRALEEGRYLIRATNDGISAIVGPHGEVLARAPEFRPVLLVSKVTPMAGLTPYADVGNWLIVTLAALSLACGIGVRNDRLWRTRSGSAGAATRRTCT
ncbi:MAG TPA: apolipoprotein N-acyltransferase [Steroidobacteraceae bacterium]|nr:apolipoprotein N-acyltransferase [Steroidobacteraceae bacterium]